MSADRIEVVRDDRGGVVLAGSLGVASVDALERAVAGLLADRPRRLAIDLAGADFIASIAIGQLMMLAQHVQLHGGRCAVSCAEGDVRDALVRCRVPRIVTLTATRDEAIGATA